MRAGGEGVTEDEMVGWHHQLNGHELEQAPGDGEGQGSLACCSPWGHKELDTTEQLNANSNCASRDEPNLWYIFLKSYFGLLIFFLPVTVLDIWIVCDLLSYTVCVKFGSMVNIGLVEKVWDYSLLLSLLSKIFYVFWNLIFGITLK